MKKVLFYCLLFFGLQAFGMNHSQPQSIEDPSPSKKISCAELEEQVNIAREEEREIQELKRSTLIEKRMKFRLYLTVAVNESPIPENHPAYFRNVDTIIAVTQDAMEGLIELPTLEQAREDYTQVVLTYNGILDQVEKAVENYRTLSSIFQINCVSP